MPPANTESPLTSYAVRQIKVMLKRKGVPSVIS